MYVHIYVCIALSVRYTYVQIQVCIYVHPNISDGISCMLYVRIWIQMIQLLQRKYCLPPPPGCPRAVYEVMVNCW